jgi:hypothetical protein
VAFVIGYLMWKNKISLNKAFEFVQNKRPIANPNVNFIKQLRNYEFFLRKNFLMKINNDNNNNSLRIF